MVDLAFFITSFTKSKTVHLLVLIMKKCIDWEKWVLLNLIQKQILKLMDKVNQPWIFIGRTDAEAPILGPPDVKSQLLGKDCDAEKYWGQEKGATEDEMVGWYHQLNGPEFEHTLGDSEGYKAWRAAVHGVAKSQTWLSDWATTKYFWEEDMGEALPPNPRPHGILLGNNFLWGSSWRTTF